MTIKGIIYDFDGVIADSEAVANMVLAEMVTALGHPTTLQDSYDLYMGKRAAEVAEAVESKLGRKLAATFSDDLRTATLARFRTDLREVSGASAFIRRHARLPSCIASSSSAERLRESLDALCLAEEFVGRVFSADLVPRGKPHPDIFLYAADRIGVVPEHCLVIEDSRSGVLAGVAAGMTVLGLCAGGHIQVGHTDLLREAGAAHVAASWEEASSFLASRLEVQPGCGAAMLRNILRGNAHEMADRRCDGHQDR
jgi:beta-phosphoglucomutase-like phosphatase (HAD superfamily)